MSLSTPKKAYTTSFCRSVPNPQSRSYSGYFGGGAVVASICARTVRYRRSASRRLICEAPVRALLPLLIASSSVFIACWQAARSGEKWNQRESGSVV
jgi:hypothetical protein